ncbi:MAG: hypothetical protein ABUL58_05590, partial [Steroidobacter sp.]
NKSNVAAAMGGGLLWALVDAGVEAHRAKVAEETVKPLRDALIGYDFDSVIQQQTKATLAAIDWFMPSDYGFVKEINLDNRSAKLSATASKEMAFVDYEYGMSANFDALELNCRISIANKNVPHDSKPVARLYPDNLAYTQWHKVVVPLNNASKEMPENVSKWSANNAVLTKQGLETALKFVQDMIKRGLLQSAENQKVIEQGKRVVAGGYGGNLIEKTGDTTLLWLPMPNDQWVLVASPVG